MASLGVREPEHQRVEATRGSAATLEECTQAAATVASETIEHFRAPNDRAIYVQEGLLIEVRFPWGEKASHAFVCLPDTVDPRGAKR